MTSQAGYLNQVVAAMSMRKNLVNTFSRKFFSYWSFGIEIERSRNSDWNLKHATFHNNPSEKLTRKITWDKLHNLKRYQVKHQKTRRAIVQTQKPKIIGNNYTCQQLLVRDNSCLLKQEVTPVFPRFLFRLVKLSCKSETPVACFGVFALDNLSHQILKTLPIISNRQLCSIYNMKAMQFLQVRVFRNRYRQEKWTCPSLVSFGLVWSGKTLKKRFRTECFLVLKYAYKSLISLLFSLIMLRSLLYWTEAGFKF